MKNFWLSMLSAFVLLGVFSACSKDQEEEGPVLLKGVNTYAGEQLALTYGEMPLLGKQVTFSTEDGKNGVIEMEGQFDMSIFSGLLTKTFPKYYMAPGVIPGELTTSLNVQLSRSGNKYMFEGTDSKDGRELKYAGEIDSTMLKLSLKVDMPANDLLGTWTPAPVIPGEADVYKSLPLLMSWQSSTSMKVDMHWISPMSPEGTFIDLPMESVVKLASVVASPLLAEALGDISFLKDGNIVARYKNKKVSTEWQNAPINLAQYYIRDKKLYVQLNLNNILALASQAESKATTKANVFDVLSQLGTLLSQGIPLNIGIDNGVATLTAGKDLILPLFNVLMDQTIMNLIFPKIPADFQNVTGGVMKQLPEILKNTTDVNASLILVKKP